MDSSVNNDSTLSPLRTSDTALRTLFGLRSSSRREIVDRGDAEPIEEPREHFRLCGRSHRPIRCDPGEAEPHQVRRDAASSDGKALDRATPLEAAERKPMH